MFRCSRLQILGPLTTRKMPIRLRTTQSKDQGHILQLTSQVTMGKLMIPPHMQLILPIMETNLACLACAGTTSMMTRNNGRQQIISPVSPKCQLVTAASTMEAA